MSSFFYEKLKLRFGRFIHECLYAHKEFTSWTLIDICSSCGKRNLKGAQFCSHCGKSFLSSSLPHLPNTEAIPCIIPKRPLCTRPLPPISKPQLIAMPVSIPASEELRPFIYYVRHQEKKITKKTLEHRAIQIGDRTIRKQEYR